MRSLPEICTWREDTNPEVAELQVRWLREQINAADLALEAQQRIIAADGPREAYLLSINSLRSSQRKHEGQLASLMACRENEILDFALDGTPYAGHRAPANALADFAHALQRLYLRIGQSLSTNRPSPVIPPAIRSLCQLEIAGFYPSSFGIRFAASTRADLTGSSLTNDALESLFSLTNAEQPLEQIAKHGHFVMTSYRHLVSTMVKIEASPKVSWRSPDGNERSWIADRNKLAILANRLASIRNNEPTILQATGTLTGASLRRHKFEFNGDDGLLTGRAPVELEDKLKQFFGQRCRITYLETVFFDEATEQEKRTRVLSDVEPV